MPSVEESDDCARAGARAAIDRGGPGHCDPPLVRQGGHREWRSTEPEDSHQDREGEEYATHYTAKFRKTLPPQAAATEYHPMTDDEGGELTAGVRPAPAEEERPQGKVVTVPSRPHLEIWTLLAAQFLARQWIQVLRLLEAFERISSIVFVKVSSDPAVDSRPALLGFFGSCSLEKCAQSLLRLRGLPELMALGIWTLFSRAPSS